MKRLYDLGVRRKTLRSVATSAVVGPIGLEKFVLITGGV
jgi:hypothetical protein